MTSSFDATSPWKTLAPAGAPAASAAQATLAADGGPVARTWSLRALAPEADLARGGFGDDGDTKAAYERGRADGKREAGEALGESQAQAHTLLAAALARLDEAVQAYVRDRQADVAALACIVARRLFEREVAADPAVVLALARQALELAPAEAEYEIRLHPADLVGQDEAVRALLPATRAASIVLIEDTSVGRGGIVVNTPRRIVDGRVDSVLRTLYEKWTDA